MKRQIVLIVLVVGMLMISFVANQSEKAQETRIALGLGAGACCFIATASSASTGSSGLTPVKYCLAPRRVL